MRIYFMENHSNFDKYIVHGEPEQWEKADAWLTAFTLQATEDLKVSDYMLNTAHQHTKCEITIDVYGRYIQLRSIVNKVTARAYFEKKEAVRLSDPKVNMKIDGLLRRFILTCEID